MKRIQLILLLLFTVALITGCRMDGGRIIFKDLTPELSLLNYNVDSNEIKDDEDGSVEYFYSVVGSVINDGPEGHCRIEAVFEDKIYSYGPVKANAGEIPFSFEATTLAPVEKIELRVYAISQEGKEKLQVDTTIY